MLNILNVVKTPPVMIKRLAKRLLAFVKSSSFRIVDLFYFPIIYKFFDKRVEKARKGRQLFLIARQEFGVILPCVHYVSLWEKSRGPTCLVILNLSTPTIKELVQNLTPSTEVICMDSWFLRLLVNIFGKAHVRFVTLNRVYNQLALKHLDAIILCEQPLNAAGKRAFSSYIRYIDPYLSSIRDLNTSFVQAYMKTRTQLDSRYPLILDYFSLSLSNPCKKSSVNQKDGYVVFHLNRKKYNVKSRVSNLVTRRGIQHPQRYNVLIDFLIEKGYQIVLYGRNEHSDFAPRKGFIDYSNSGNCSISNDIALFQNADFFISSKSGPELFGAIYDLPTLGLNYTEFCGMIPHSKLRYYPKHLKSLSSGSYVHWQDFLNSPSFFDVGSHSFSNDIEYVDMREDEMVRAIEEFLPLAQNPNFDWSKPTALQAEFSRRLTPLHLDLYHCKALPCECFLNFSEYTK